MLRQTTCDVGRKPEDGDSKETKQRKYFRKEDASIS